MILILTNLSMVEESDVQGFIIFCFISFDPRKFHQFHAHLHLLLIFLYFECFQENPALHFNFGISKILILLMANTFLKQLLLMRVIFKSLSICIHCHSSIIPLRQQQFFLMEHYFSLSNGQASLASLIYSSIINTEFSMSCVMFKLSRKAFRFRGLMYLIVSSTQKLTSNLSNGYQFIKHLSEKLRTLYLLLAYSTQNKCTFIFNHL